MCIPHSVYSPRTPSLTKERERGAIRDPRQRHHVEPTFLIRTAESPAKLGTRSDAMAHDEKTGDEDETGCGEVPFSSGGQFVTLFTSLIPSGTEVKSLP